MKCEGMQDLWVDYLYGELDGARLEAFRVHVEVCSACATRLGELARLRERISARSDPEPSAILVQRVLAHAREEAAIGRRPLGLGWLKAAAPIGFVVVVGMWILLQQDFVRVGREAPSPEKGGAKPPVEAGLPPVSEMPFPVDAASSLAESSAKPPAPLPGDVLPEKKGTVDVAPGPVGRESERRQAVGKEAPQPSPRVAVPPAMTPRQKAKSEQDPSASVGEKAEPRSDVLGGPAPPSAEGAAPSDPAQGDASLAALLARGEDLLRSGDFGGALKAFSQALKGLAKGHVQRPLALLGLARAYEGEGRVEDARRLYLALAEESPAHRDQALRKLENLPRP